jgi:hypothetical protein
MDDLFFSETFLSTPLLISHDLQDGLSLYFWDIAINTTTDLTWPTRWIVFVLLRHSYQHHCWSHLIYKMNFYCTSETFLSTPLLISYDLQDGLFCTSETFLSTPLLISPDLHYGRSLYFWDISINITTDLTWSTRWTVFVPPKHSYQPHYWSHLIYKMECPCTSETFISTTLLISPDLQYERSLYFWDIPINTTTHLTWSTTWTVFVLLRHSYQHHYWSQMNYKMNWLCTSETFISTPLLISPDLQYRLSLYFWDISINTTTDLTWSTRWTVFLLLRHCYQHHYWSHLIYKIDGLCTSETFLSKPLLISPDLQDELALYFWDIPINTTIDLKWTTRWTGFVLLRHSYQHHYSSHLIYNIDFLCTSETFLSTPLLISPDLQDELSFYFWDIVINTITDLTWSTRWTGFVLLRHCYQHHYWSQPIYKIDCLCTSETFLSTPLLISPDLQDELDLYFCDIAINTTTDLT